MQKKIPRRVMRYPVRLELAEINGQSAQGSYVLDISALGAKLETVAPLSPRELVDFAFFLPEEHTPRRLAGQVVWMRPAPTAPERFWVGVRLLQSVWELDQLGRRWQSLADDH